MRGLSRYQSGNFELTDFAKRYGPWALVTGASSGIGAEFARQIAGRGIHVVLIARRTKCLQTLASEIEYAHGVETLVLDLDLTLTDAIWTVNERIGDRAIGLLINNAGFGRSGRSGRFIDQRLSDHNRMLDLNCRAPLLLTHPFAGAMAKRGRGGIIFTSSTAGLIATSRLAHYSATKAWDHFMAQTLHAELAGDGVDVLSVCPGPTDTEFFGDGEFRPDRWPKVMRKQMLRSEDVVRAALDKLGRTSIVVPGLSNRLMVLALRLVPERYISRLTNCAMRRVSAARGNRP